MVAVKHWFERWRDILALVFVAGTFWLLWHQGSEIKSIVRGNTHVTTTQCRRTREFGLPLASFYEKQKALNAKQLYDYRKTIPPRC